MEVHLTEEKIAELNTSTSKKVALAMTLLEGTNASPPLRHQIKKVIWSVFDEITGTIKIKGEGKYGGK